MIDIEINNKFREELVDDGKIEITRWSVSLKYNECQPSQTISVEGNCYWKSLLMLVESGNLCKHGE